MNNVIQNHNYGFQKYLDCKSKKKFTGNNPNEGLNITFLICIAHISHLSLFV